jgi:N-acetylmuramic acid 6-phosphate etherase
MCNKTPFLAFDADVEIKIDTGPEVITGSTRMKAGTATKMVLNMISTTSMIKLGKVYGNLMVDLMAVNDKLIDRGTRIIMQLTSLGYQDSLKALQSANMSVKVAVVMVKNNCQLEEALESLKREDGNLRKIIQ